LSFSVFVAVLCTQTALFSETGQLEASKSTTIVQAYERLSGYDVAYSENTDPITFAADIGFARTFIVYGGATLPAFAVVWGDDNNITFHPIPQNELKNPGPDVAAFNIGLRVSSFFFVCC
jgi:hypothetical protein